MTAVPVSFLSYAPLPDRVSRQRSSSAQRAVLPSVPRLALTNCSTTQLEDGTGQKSATGGVKVSAHALTGTNRACSVRS